MKSVIVFVLGVVAGFFYCRYKKQTDKFVVGQYRSLKKKLTEKKKEEVK